MDREIASLNFGKNGLDNDYTLFESGKILREYDRHIYPGGQNRKEELTADDLSANIKDGLLANVAEADLVLAKSLLKVN